MKHSTHACLAIEADRMQSLLAFKISRMTGAMASCSIKLGDDLEMVLKDEYLLQACTR